MYEILEEIRQLSLYQRQVITIPNVEETGRNLKNSIRLILSNKYSTVYIQKVNISENYITLTVLDEIDNEWYKVRFRYSVYSYVRNSHDCLQLNLDFMYKKVA